MVKCSCRENEVSSNGAEELCPDWWALYYTDRRHIGITVLSLDSDGRLRHTDPHINGQFTHSFRSLLGVGNSCGAYTFGHLWRTLDQSPNWYSLFHFSAIICFAFFLFYKNIYLFFINFLEIYSLYSLVDIIVYPKEKKKKMVPKFSLLFLLFVFNFSLNKENNILITKLFCLLKN